MNVHCVLVSHNKPDYVCEAIDSVLAQTHTDWCLSIWDSGILLDANYFDRWTDDRLNLLRSPEKEIHAQGLSPAPFLFNETLRCGLVCPGSLVAPLCDDDVYYVHAFQTFSDFFTSNPEAQAAYFTEDVGLIRPDGRREIVSERGAWHPRGPGGFNCIIDYLQFIYRVEAAEQWPEEPKYKANADGVFMERMAAKLGVIPNCPTKIGCNRRTPVSTYGPTR